MKIIDKVENKLRMDKELRNSDKKLLLAIWEIEGLNLSESQQRIFLDRCTTAESITRARRHLRDKYPAKEHIEEERFNKFQEYKNNKAVSWL